MEVLELFVFLGTTWINWLHPSKKPKHSRNATLLHVLAKKYGNKKMHAPGWSVLFRIVSNKLGSEAQLTERNFPAFPSPYSLLKHCLLGEQEVLLLRVLEGISTVSCSLLADVPFYCQKTLTGYNPKYISRLHWTRINVLKLTELGNLDKVPGESFVGLKPRSPSWSMNASSNFSCTSQSACMQTGEKMELFSTVL